MSHRINIYCDESCHLENDGQKAMVLGAIWTPADKVDDIHARLRELKKKHGLSSYLEIKWRGVSSSKAAFFLDVLDYFFDTNDLHFRAIIVPDKSKLDHAIHHQTHDDFYYKMYFNLLKIIIDSSCHYHIYVDIKDTWSKVKVAKLWEVLSNAKYDFSRRLIQRIQQVRSHEVGLIQLTDLLTGIISYRNRNLRGNSGKEQLVERMQQRSHRSLTQSTLPRESKVNLFCWQATEAEQ